MGVPLPRRIVSVFTCGARGTAHVAAIRTKRRLIFLGGFLRRFLTPLEPKIAVQSNGWIARKLEVRWSRKALTACRCRAGSRPGGRGAKQGKIKQQIMGTGRPFFGTGDPPCKR